MLKVLWAELTFAVTLGLAALAGYFASFNDGLSEKQEIWGQFGDFLGGTLNPIFGFLTLFAIMLSIVIQNRELHNSSEELKKSAEAAQKTSAHFEREAKRADLYRLIEKLTERINRNYNENRLDEGLSLHRVISEKSRPLPTITRSEFYAIYANQESDIYRTIKWIEGDLRRLMGYLQKYELVSDYAEGETPLPDFFRAEYQETVEFLKDSSMIADDISQYFSSQPA